MSSERAVERDSGAELRRLERNHYFDGKLMTARDMAAEQGYHRDRLDTLSRLATGAGVLFGLEATVERSGDRLEVTVERGAAVDHAGRLVVVPRTETRRLPDETPSGEVAYLYLQYDESYDERVPRPGAGALSESDCEYNRLVETFEVRFGPPPSGEKTARIPEIDFPTEAEVRSDEASALGSVARSYRENVPERDEEAAVFLGAFDSGSWRPVSEETERRPLAYDNDMLYAALVRHVTDFDNPHGVTAGEEGAPRPGPGGLSEDEVRRLVDELGLSRDDVEEIVEENRGLSEADVEGIVEARLESVESELAELDALRDRTDALEGYVRQRSLLGTCETFLGVREEFRDHRIGDLADEIIGEATRMIDDATFEDEDDYRAFVEDVSDREVEVADIVEEEERSTEEVRAQYRAAVERLEDELGDDAGVLGLAIAQDAVCEAAKRLERPVNV